MSTLQKNHYNNLAGVDYKPAELKKQAKGKWIIVFYCRIPGSDNFKRFRRNVKQIQPNSLRNEIANNKIAEINNNLKLGWSPFENNSFQYHYYIMDLLDDFIEKYTIGVEKELIRPDTLRTYTSHVKNFKLYLKKFEFENITCKDFNKAFVVKFVDYLDKHKKLRARTTNNYITFLNQFCIFMVDRGILENNPATTIKKRKEGTKIRRLIPEHIKQKIFSYLKNKNKRYFILCLMTYLCFVRRTELTKLKVKHVSLYDGLLNIPAHISKNGLDGHVTIPNVLIEYLAEHLAEANNEDFIFSKNDFFPGDQQLRPKYISDEWTKMRTKLKLPSYYQFYSLKDTGITEYIKKGMDLLSVRDQARHQEIKTTESYMPRSNSANETIRNVDVAI